MTETVTITFEASFNGTDWTDISADVLESWTLETGQSSVQADKLLADVGVLSFELRNGTSNSAGLNGYYSPGHANCRSGFARKLPVRLKTVYSGTTRYYKFYVKSINVDAGAYGPRKTHVIAQDLFASMSRENVGLLAVQTAVRSDELLDLLVADMVSAPDNTSFATGPDIFASAFTDIESEKMKITAVANHIIMSDWSRLFIAADATDGETLTSITRSAGSGASEVTISNDMVDITPEVTLDNLVSRVRVTSFPNAVDADEETVYTHPNELYVGPGETKDFYAKFTDATTGERICASNVVTTLVAGTHFRASSQATNGGSDMNGNCSITISSMAEPVGADRVHVYVENTNTTYALYLNLFILKGSPIRRRDTFEFEAVSATIGTDNEDATITIKMPYCSDTNLPESIANKIIDDWGAESVVRSYSVDFSAIRNSTLADLAFVKPLGTKITLQEVQSGLNFVGLVMGKSFDRKTNGDITCRLVVDPSFGISGWNLGVDHLGVAGETVLAL